MEYSFFDIISLKINSKQRNYNKYFENEYARIAKETKKQISSKISVYITNDLPKAQSGDHKSTIRVKNLFSYTYLIRNLDNEETEVYFKKHWIDKVYIKAIAVFLQAQIIEPIMYYKLLGKDVLFMHSSGVSDGKNAYVFPAHGGTGKTTLSLSLVQAGYKFMGDDLLFIDTKSKTVYPYLRPLHIFSYNVRTLRNAKIPLKYKITVKFKDILRKILQRIYKTEFLISTRIHIEEIYNDIALGPPSKLKKIVFLKKTGNDSHDVINEKTIRGICNTLLESFDLNDSLYDNIITNKTKAAEAKALEVKTVTKLLRNYQSIDFVNTRKIDIHNPTNVLEILRK